MLKVAFAIILVFVVHNHTYAQFGGDFDRDGIADYEDDDADGDGFSNEEEGYCQERTIEGIYHTDFEGGFLSQEQTDYILEDGINGLFQFGSQVGISPTPAKEWALLLREAQDIHDVPVAYRTPVLPVDPYGLYFVNFHATSFDSEQNAHAQLSVQAGAAASAMSYIAPPEGYWKTIGYELVVGNENAVSFEVYSDAGEVGNDGFGIDNLGVSRIHCEHVNSDGDASADYLDADSDGDGLSDREEWTIGTSPQLQDSDGDSITDIVEYGGISSPTDADTDDDGITDDKEDVNRNGIIEVGETSPHSSDSDGDGIQDGTERGITRGHPTDTDEDVFVPDYDAGLTVTNPLNADTDGGGQTDGEEDSNRNGYVEQNETYPSIFGDDDGDQDGLNNHEEAQVGTAYSVGDTDNDSLPDGDEVNIYNTNPISLDTDSDSLTDSEEIFLYKTDPLQFDTDGDGFSDGDEVYIYRTDPNKAPVASEDPVTDDLVDDILDEAEEVEEIVEVDEVEEIEEMEEVIQEGVDEDVMTDSVVVDSLESYIYRFWSQEYNAHFYTISSIERDRIIAQDPNWHFEGRAFKAFANTLALAQPVYRFWSPEYRAHFYTISQSERDAVIANDPQWTYEGIGWYAYQQPADSVMPVYRFWSQEYKAHFYTVRDTERDHIIENDPFWIFEGVVYYVPFE